MASKTPEPDNPWHQASNPLDDLREAAKVFRRSRKPDAGSTIDVEDGVVVMRNAAGQVVATMSVKAYEAFMRAGAGKP